MYSVWTEFHMSAFEYDQQEHDADQEASVQAKTDTTLAQALMDVGLVHQVQSLSSCPDHAEENSKPTPPPPQSESVLVKSNPVESKVDEHHGGDAGPAEAVVEIDVPGSPQEDPSHDRAHDDTASSANGQTPQPMTSALPCPGKPSESGDDKTDDPKVLGQAGQPSEPSRPEPSELTEGAPAEVIPSMLSRTTASGDDKNGNATPSVIVTCAPEPVAVPQPSTSDPGLSDSEGSSEVETIAEDDVPAAEEALALEHAKEAAAAAAAHAKAAAKCKAASQPKAKAKSANKKHTANDPKPKKDSSKSQPKAKSKAKAKTQDVKHGKTAKAKATQTRKRKSSVTLF